MVQLIPKQKKKGPSIMAGALFGDTWALISLGALVFAILVYAALFLYERGLDSEVKEIVSQAESAAKNRNVALENEARNLSNRIVAIDALLDSRVHSLGVFTAIEEATHPQVRFRSFSFDGAGNKIVLSGTAPSYKILGEQLIALEEDERFNEIKLSNLKTEREGGVSFSLSFVIK